MDDLLGAQLALPKYTIHERDGHLANRVSERARTHHHFHLENVSARDGQRDDVPQHRDLVQAEGARKVADAGVENGIREEVGSAGDELAFEVPAVDAAWCRTRHGRAGGGAVSCARDDVKVMRLL